MPINPQTNEEYEILYLGPRYKHSLEVHKAFSSNQTKERKKHYKFQFPPNLGIIEQIIKATHR